MSAAIAVVAGVVRGVSDCRDGGARPRPGRARRGDHRRARPAASRRGRRSSSSSGALAQVEAHFVYRLQTVGGFGGKSDQLNGYNMVVADPGYFDTDLARYRDVTADGVRGVDRSSS